MADKLHVDIVTVEGRRFKGDADFVVAPGSEGELGILPRHIPLLTPLAPGSVKVRNEGEEQFFFVSGGFLEVRPDQVTVLADSAERADDIDEAATMVRLLEGMGVRIRWLDPQQLQVDAERLAKSEVLAAMANRMRASFLLMGPLLARRGEARVAKPGGDDIGMRRVEQHIVGLRLMGAKVDLEDGDYVARADRLKGAT